MINRLKQKGIIRQIAVYFLIGIILTGVLTYFTQIGISAADVRRQIERMASGDASEVMEAIKEYPSYKWLLSYWYQNWETMDIEYDAGYSHGTGTEKKYELFSKTHPDFVIKYASEGDVKALSEEDQKIFAEIVYSWFITRIDQIKLSQKVDYLFGVVTDENFEDQFFLFSAADPGSVRGTNYEEVYPLGVQVTVTGSQSQAMKNARENMSHLAEAGNYMDYYAYFGDVDGHPLLVGLTFNVSDMMEDIKYSTFSGTTTAVVGQIVLSLICLILMYFFVLDPLMKIMKNIREYTDTKDSADIISNLRDVHPNNEIGELSNDITQLAQEMDDYYTKIETITKERERISTELDLASRIQASMLPSSFPAFPERDEFDVFASMTPAKAVGGDFYDFYMIDADHLCITMADVSGKGVPASLFMMIAMIMLRNHARTVKSPAKTITDVNNIICESNEEEMFVTVWIGVLELSTGKLTYTNAGHEYPAIRRAGGKYEIVKGRHGFIVGGMPDLIYKEETIDIEPGSSIFLYTDGVPEATAEDRSMYGTGRMIEALNSDPDASPEKVVRNIIDSVDSFVKDAEQFDDMTLMCLNYKGPSQKG